MPGLFYSPCPPLLTFVILGRFFPFHKRLPDFAILQYKVKTCRLQAFISVCKWGVFLYTSWHTFEQTKLEAEKTKSKQNQKRAWIYFLAVITFFVILMLYQNTREKNLLAEFDTTKGKMTEFDYCNYARCGSYVYFVNNQRFEGHFVSEYFECPDGTPGCIGHEFKIKYSKKDPSVSEIDLGKYNKKKNYKPAL